MRRPGLLLLVLVFGCSMQAKPASPGAAGHPLPASDFELPIAAAPTSASPKPQPAAEAIDPRTQRVAVLVDRPQDRNSYTVSLVAFDGSVLASKTAQQPEPFSVHYDSCPDGGGPCDRKVSVPAPLTSVSWYHAYYLDGGQVMSMERDGSSMVVAHVPAGPRTFSAFAVSAREQRIAVSVLDYSRYPNAVSMRLYAEDLFTGRNRVDLFDSNTVVEWPVSWLTDQLMVAVGDPVDFGGWYANPGHTRSGYHVVDPATGTRTTTMSDQCIYGPVWFGRSACRLDGTPAVQSEDGRIMPAQQLGRVAGDSLLVSPSGTRVAAVEAGGDHLLVGGKLPEAFTSPSGIPVGWLDEEHLLFNTLGAGMPAVLHVHNGAVSPVGAAGELVGTVGVRPDGHG